MAEPGFMQPFVLSPPEIEAERQGPIDLYIPVQEDQVGRPAILFVHGGPVPDDLRPTPRSWPVFIGYGRAAAERGAVGVTLDHRLHSTASHELAASEIAAAAEAVRADERIDGDRMALWLFSGGGLLSAPWLANPPRWLRCLAMTYPFLDSFPDREVEEDFRPIRELTHAGDLPLVLSRAGLDRPELLATNDEFIERATSLGARLEVIDVPGGRHGFDHLDHTDESRAAVNRALDLVTEALI